MKTDKTVTISRSEFLDIALDEIATFADAIRKTDGKDKIMAIILIDLFSTIITKIAIRMFKED